MRYGTDKLITNNNNRALAPFSIKKEEEIIEFVSVL